MAKSDKDDTIIVEAAPPSADLRRPPAGPNPTAPGRPKGWKHDRAAAPGGRYIVNGVAVDAHGNELEEKATPEELAARGPDGEPLDPLPEPAPAPALGPDGKPLP